MAEFEYRAPVIPQLNFKKTSSKRCQILESGSLDYHNLNLQHMLIRVYKQVLSQADHDCGYLKDPGVLKSYLLSGVIKHLDENPHRILER